MLPDKLIVALLLLVSSVFCDYTNNEICDLPTELVEEIAGYRSVVDRIINAIINGKFKGGTYKELANFVDKFGSRIAGSENLENSIDYVLDLMKEYKLENVHGENVTVPHWVRGKETAQLLQPRTATMDILALGSSVGTPEEGITAEVIVVRSFDELDQRQSSVKGKIVVFNNEYVSYGVSVAYRSQGARRAAQYGAVAALIRSVTPFSMYTLHTGHQSYDDSISKIPALSITVEDARMLQRIQDRGEKIVIKLKVQSESFPNAISRNVVGEVVGKQNPEKVVIVSGHIDSWDVGVGAMDDGGGAFISWYSLAVLQALNLKPKRTIRSVLWTGEEEGYYGVLAYNESHKNDLDNFVFIMESDEGTFTPQGIEYATSSKGGCIIQEIVKLLDKINATQSKSAQAVGSDISIWAGKIPTGSLLNDNGKYFWFHHSDADTMDVLDPNDLDKATAVWAAVAYVIADLKEDFPRDFNSSTESLLLKKLRVLAPKINEI